MIVDGRLTAQIDQISGNVVLGGNRESVETKKLQSLAKWADTLSNITDGLANKMM
jgi:hypothetical protein